MKEIIKDCKHHGQNQIHVVDSIGRSRCKKCRSKAVIKSRKKRKQKLVEYRGGRCELCNYSKCYDALEFHHINPDEKEFGLCVRGLTRSWEEIINECMKCILICSNCHRELHNGMTKIPEDYTPIINEKIELKIIKGRSRPYDKKDIRVCTNCNKKYQAKSKNQKYCSSKCNIQVKNKLNRTSKKIMK